MDRPPLARNARPRRRSARVAVAATVAAVVVVGVAIVATTATTEDDPPSAGPLTSTATSASLPNPMGGPAVPAPGVASGHLTLAGLEVADRVVAMGEVGLGVTYVPRWEVTNPTDREVRVTAGQPQVLEGCCPGPVYVDGELIAAGQPLVVPAGGAVLLQFPLQMHVGMDGPHQLAIPLSADGEHGAVFVTADFTPSVEVDGEAPSGGSR